MRAEGLSAPSPRKRPRSSYKRFRRAQANELWQLDGIEWELPVLGQVTIYQVIDDHSRYCPALLAHPGGETHEGAKAVLEAGFAKHLVKPADPDELLELGRAKLARKGCDLLVVNDVSGGRVFGRADNAAVVLSADGSAAELPEGSKDAVAAGIWDAVSAVLTPPKAPVTTPAGRLVFHVFASIAELEQGWSESARLWR